MKSKTFTLIELILVVAIVAILAAVMVPMIRSARQKARIAKILLLMDVIKSGCMLYYGDTGVFPELTSMNARPASNGLFFDDGTPGWDGPYVDRLLTMEDNPFGSVIGVANIYPTNFDLDGDNVMEKPMGTAGNVFGFHTDSREDAQKIDQRLDPGIPGDWRLKGRVVWLMNPWLGRRMVYILLYDPIP